MKYNLTIRGTVGSWWSGTCADEVLDYLGRHQEEHLDVAICSPGGSVSEGLEIYQAFRDHGNITAHIIGMTASIATIIAMGAKNVEMVKGSLMLVHQASAPVLEWTSANKDQLQKIIDKYAKQKSDLETIDDLLASIYSDRTGKTLDECRKKMKDAAWLTAEDAKAFGFVDSIRDEAEMDTKEVINHFTNNITHDFGLPALPSSAMPVLEPADSGNGQAIADAEGNPTDSFIAKTWQKLQDLIVNKHAQKKTIMKKTFEKIGNLLGVEGFEEREGSVSMKTEDAQRIEDRLAELENNASNAQAHADSLQKKLDTANATIAELEENVEDLKNAPGADADEKPEEHVSHLSTAQKARAMFNAYKNL